MFKQKFLIPYLFFVIIAVFHGTAFCAEQEDISSSELYVEAGSLDRVKLSPGLVIAFNHSVSDFVPDIIFGEDYGRIAQRIYNYFPSRTKSQFLTGKIITLKKGACDTRRFGMRTRALPKLMVVGFSPEGALHKGLCSKIAESLSGLGETGDSYVDSILGRCCMSKDKRDRFGCFPTSWHQSVLGSEIKR